MSLLGIDLGTTGIKCVAYDAEGKTLGKTYREYPLFTPEEGVVELDPNIVWTKLCLNLKELNNFKTLRKDPIEALSISVSGDEAVPVDRKGNPLYNTIMAMDIRGEKENNWVNETIGAEKIYAITGQPPAPMYPLNRLLWFKNNKPEIFKNIYKFLAWEEFIFLKLGVEPITDYSVACRSLVFDIIKKNYSDYILSKAGIDIDLFPKALPSGTVIGEIGKAIADELGFDRSVKVATGGFDQICAALGAGVVKEGMASVGTGTMELAHVCFKNPAMSSKIMSYGYPFCNHAVGDLYISMTINFCGGVIFKWYRDNLSHFEKEYAEKNSLNLYDVIMDSARKSKSPVMFLPYFEGAQTPRNNPDISGTILGLNLRTTREDIVKGMFEGITFDLRLNLEKIEETGIKIDALRATGGGARSDTWLKIKSDITGKLIQKIGVDESGCMAAAILAGYGIEKFGSIESVVEYWVKIEKEFEPDIKIFAGYREKYEQFLSIYDNLKNYKIIH